MEVLASRIVQRIRGLVVQIDRHIRRIRAGTHPIPRQGADDRDAALQPDIVESGRIEAKLTWIASLIESSDNAMISINLEGIITSWDKGAQRIYGFTADEAIGKPMATLVPGNHANEIPTILTKIAHGKRVDHYETKGITKAGHLLEVSLFLSPVRDSSGAIIGAFFA